MKFEIYSSKFSYWLNTFFFPLKMLIPQPIIGKIPFFLTNEEIRIRHVLNYAKGKLIDIGCGNNLLVKKYRNSGKEAIGIDVFDWEGVDVIVKDTSCLPFPDKSCDTITFVACLNHIPNREKVLKESHRLLVENGQIILTNLPPFISWVWHKWAFWDRDQHERGMKKGEVWGFTRRELMLLLKKTGFQIVSKKYFAFGLNQIYVCKKDI